MGPSGQRADHPRIPSLAACPRSGRRARARAGPRGGKLKTSRRGLARYRVVVRGRAGHSGTAETESISAVEELCRLALAAKALEDAEAGTDVNIGTISGGRRYNVVASEASAEVGVRMWTAAEAERVGAAFARLRPRHDKAEVEISGGLLWPPMERSSATHALVARAERCAQELGIPLGEGPSGASSDGCYCAAVGAAVLAGLGAIGEGAHADNEHVLVGAMPRRAALVARLLETLRRSAIQEVEPP